MKIILGHEGYVELNPIAFPSIMKETISTSKRMQKDVGTKYERLSFDSQLC